LRIRDTVNNARRAVSRLLPSLKLWQTRKSPAPDGSIFIYLIIISIFISLICAPGANSGVSGEKPEEAAFFYAAKAEWDQETEKLEKQGKPAKGRRDQKLLREFLTSWPESDFADQAFLTLLEEGTCLDWKGYPDCGVIEVRVYEEFLKRYPNSQLREEVELRMAEAYYQMAYLWIKGAGEHSEKWSDLFRAQGLKIALKLKKSHNPAVSKSVEELEKKLSNNFPRPIAPIPAEVLRPDYL